MQRRTIIVGWFSSFSHEINRKIINFTFGEKERDGSFVVESVKR
jgi:hypothetical protein